MVAANTRRAAALLSALAFFAPAAVLAHGHLQEISVDGQTYPGCDPNGCGDESVGWHAKNGAAQATAPGHNGVPGFPVHTKDFGNAENIACSYGATPAKKSAKAKAGSEITLKWNNQWANDHRGAILNYLAKCDGDCSSADPGSLKFFKIDEAAYVSGGPPGKWVTDDFMATKTLKTKLPSDLAPGGYVLRHEIIALHTADKEYNAGTGDGGAQAYPQCVNLEVEGSGTKTYDGVGAAELYKPEDKGIKFNIYVAGVENYKPPGPPVVGGGSKARPRVRQVRYQ